MADFDAVILEPEILAATPDPIPAVILQGSQGATSPTIYLMRGWRPGTSDYETWKAVGAPNTSNPSGDPIIDITVQASWKSST